MLKSLETALTGVASVHHGHTAEIEVLDDSTARGIWAMSDILRPASGTPFREVRGHGHYHETYRRAEGGWQIATLKLTRLAVDIDPASVVAGAG
ncbi:nuclear transport factor 2 family protein [Nocardioides sp. NPDC051685]|uniref:nuclear transport factor 2 family protein n=1 Tax=Nocardioides sp. NPDC051685 TaxID=3364334 RepID=UPI0037ADF29E